MEDIMVALQLEKDGYEYYMEAARKCPNEYGKKMFEKLARDEITHLQRFREIAEEIMGEKVDTKAEGKHLDIFEKIDFSTKAGEYAALDHAIKFEERARDYFREAAKRAGNDKLRNLFEKISDEEEMHLRLLEAERGYLHKSGIWFNYQEFEMDGM